MGKIQKKILMKETIIEAPVKGSVKVD